MLCTHLHTHTHTHTGTSPSVGEPQCERGAGERQRGRRAASYAPLRVRRRHLHRHITVPGRARPRLPPQQLHDLAHRVPNLQVEELHRVQLPVQHVRVLHLGSSQLVVVLRRNLVHQRAPAPPLRVRCVRAQRRHVVRSHRALAPRVRKVRLVQRRGVLGKVLGCRRRRGSQLPGTRSRRIRWRRVSDSLAGLPRPRSSGSRKQRRKGVDDVLHHVRRAPRVAGTTSRSGHESVTSSTGLLAHQPRAHLRRIRCARTQRSLLRLQRVQVQPQKAAVVHLARAHRIASVQHGARLHQREVGVMVLTGADAAASPPLDALAEERLEPVAEPHALLVEQEARALHLPRRLVHVRAERHAVASLAATSDKHAAPLAVHHAREVLARPRKLHVAVRQRRDVRGHARAVPRRHKLAMDHHVRPEVFLVLHRVRRWHRPVRDLQRLLCGDPVRRRSATARVVRRPRRLSVLAACKAQRHTTQHRAETAPCVLPKSSVWPSVAAA
ncbi:hypothetical protein, conserved [Leishmania tarentolae]|uniref:Uncharacterized protein n=1 Tax=Leishmania tarentolae TaxID=5689 RepID=A0A640KQK2_LEITA|nr:hypothetical protein, conserved [Leishmania tarentolae]